MLPLGYEKNLTIYQIPKKGWIPQKLNKRAAEYYHRRRAQNLIPVRYTAYKDLNDEQYASWIAAVTRSRMLRYHRDPKYKARVNRIRLLASMRARQKADGRVKRCKCGAVKAHVDFEQRSLTCNTPRYECKTCRKERNRSYYLKNKDKHKTPDGEWTVVYKRIHNDD